MWPAPPTAGTGYGRHWIWPALDNAGTGYGRHWIWPALDMAGTGYGRHWIWPAWRTAGAGRTEVGQRQWGQLTAARRPKSTWRRRVSTTVARMIPWNHPTRARSTTHDQ